MARKVREERKNIVIEGATLIFKNFAGKKKGTYDEEGVRKFCVLIENDLAEVLKSDGWNVRYLKPVDEDEAPQPYLQVKVSYMVRPPKIVLVRPSNDHMTIVEEENLYIIDFADIEFADMVISPYHYDINGKKGISAYLQSLYITLHEDPLELKYYNAPESAADAIGGCGNCEECDGSCVCNDG